MELYPWNLSLLATLCCQEQERRKTGAQIRAKYVHNLGVAKASSLLFVTFRPVEGSSTAPRRAASPKIRARAAESMNIDLLVGAATLGKFASRAWFGGCERKGTKRDVHDYAPSS